MKHIDNKILAIKSDLIEMFLLVQKQLRDGVSALTNLDKQLAHAVVNNDQLVNDTELRIDKDCEHFVALYNPVAVDLRFVFAIFKINSHLESIGDAAKGISRFALEINKQYEKGLIEEIQLKRMYEIANEMMESNLNALRNDDSALARAVFEKGKEMNAINKQAGGVVAVHIGRGATDIAPLLDLVSAIRKIERVGDLSVHIAEELIFYMEAKVVKHEGGKHLL